MIYCRSYRLIYQHILSRRRKLPHTDLDKKAQARQRLRELAKRMLPMDFAGFFDAAYATARGDAIGDNLLLATFTCSRLRGS
jgi:hypothetical protein